MRHLEGKHNSNSKLMDIQKLIFNIFGKIMHFSKVFSVLIVGVQRAFYL